MHKRTNRTHLTVAEGQAGRPRARAAKPAPFKKRANRRKRNWNRGLKQFALGLFLAEVGVLLFANPALRVTQVRVEGMQTLTSDQIFQEAQVPNRTNIFWMLRQPIAKRLESDPVIDHAARSIELPNRLVLTVTERQPRAVLAGGGQFWLLDNKGVPYRQLDKPLPHVPIVQVAAAVLPDEVTLGKPLHYIWLTDAYRLLALLEKSPDLSVAKITVDQNLNLCLNRKDNLQIRLGQPDSLPQKMAQVDEIVAADSGALARQAAYIDVSSPLQPVYMPRKDTGRPGRNQSEHNGTQSRTD